MPTSYNFAGRKITLPGSYSQIKSGVDNPALALNYGRTLVIDTGSGSSFGGGAGINGTNASGKDALYTFTTIGDFQQFVKGGLWWLLARPLFSPAPGQPGISDLTYVRAAQTSPATLNYSFSGGGSNGGNLTITTVDEGEIANGAEDTNSNLTVGYASTISAGVIDNTKFIIRFFRGTYKGDDSFNSGSYDGVAETDTTPDLVAESPEFATLGEFIDWANNDADFNEFFTLTSSTVNGDGSLDSQDVTDNSGNNLFSGASETFSSDEIDKVLDAVQDINFDFILADQYGSNAESSDNLKILSYITNEANIKPDLVIGGGQTETEFSTQSITAATNLNNQYTRVIHGGVKINKQGGSGFKTYPAIYHAAAILGRDAGNPPEVPMTFKNIGVPGLQHRLNTKEQKQALNAGVMVTADNSGIKEVVKGINTLQRNNFLVNEDGTTHSTQIRRIARQLNKELSVNATLKFLKSEDGPNRTTASAEDIKNFTEGYLNGVSGTLIVDFRNVNVTISGDQATVTFEFEPSVELNFLFFTGFIVNV